MTFRQLVSLLALALVGLGPDGAAFAQSGLQITSDQSVVLVSKDVAGSRWAIAAPASLATVTGNIFPLEGGEPQFVYCRLDGTQGAPGASDEQLTFSCQLAANCFDTSCPASGWTAIPAATLPRSFFQADATGGSTAGRIASLGSPAQDVPAGTQITPDAESYLVNKDVGSQRWAISFEEETGRVTGNVFELGQEPSFVSCNRVGDDGNPDVNERIYTFDCEGANSCRDGNCGAGEWADLGQVELPAGFFLSRVAQTDEEADATVKATVDNGRYLDLTYVNDAAGANSVGFARVVGRVSSLGSVSQTGNELVEGGSVVGECFDSGVIEATCRREGDELVTEHRFNNCRFTDAAVREQTGLIRYRHTDCVPITTRPIGVDLAEESVDLVTRDLDAATGQLLATSTRNFTRIVRYENLCPQSTGDETSRSQFGTLEMVLELADRTVVQDNVDVSFRQDFSDDCSSFTQTILAGQRTSRDTRGSQDVGVTFDDFAVTPAAVTSANGQFLGIAVDSSGGLRLSCNVVSTTVETLEPVLYSPVINCPVGGRLRVMAFGVEAATARFTETGGVVIEHASGQTDSYPSCDDLSGLLGNCS